MSCHIFLSSSTEVAPMSLHISDTPWNATQDGHGQGNAKSNLI
jgi:hypothetical protein